MKKIILFTLIAIFLNSCGTDSNDLQGEFNIKGSVVAAPSNTPLSGVIVRVSNESYTLASTTTKSDGTFSLYVDKENLDKSYYVTILDPTTEIIKRVEISGIGRSGYDYGSIILYDERNPYDLPTFDYNGYTYVVHPILRRSYALRELSTACEGLNDFGINEWFLPNKNEFLQILNLGRKGELILPHELYWTSDHRPYFNYNTGDFNEAYTYISINSNSNYTISSSANLDQMACVVPVATFL